MTAGSTPAARVGVKICGLTLVEDVRWAIECGADFLGVVLCESRRRSTLDVAALLVRAAHESGPSRPVLAVLMDPDDTLLDGVVAAGFDGAQLHGNEKPARLAAIRERHPGLLLWKAIRVGSPSDLEAVADYAADAVLLDSRSASAAGGTGESIPVAPEHLRRLTPSHRIVLAGGLDADNVAARVHDIGPWAVDVSSGVESAPGIKDRHRVRRFIDTAQAAGKQGSAAGWETST